ncbi:MAG: OB-fold domain-containing protein [Thermoplasmata archaeon]|nr:MAG: OB-fold domain-containing protein [Thermoplasmata archaeon]
MVQIDLPYILDFYPQESEEQTQIHKFFTNLKSGKLTTTKCTKCGTVLWQPRIVCRECLSDELEWIDLPTTGKLYAFTQVNAGAAITLEKDVPFCIGVVELDDVGIKILSRIDNAKYEDLDFDMPVKMKVVENEDGRVMYRFEPVK